MSNLQITLGIVGVLVIIGIVGHGLWTMRKNNQPVKQKTRQKPRQKPAADRQPARESDGASVKASDEPTMDVEQMSMNLDLDDDNAPLPSMRVDEDDQSQQQQQQFSAAEPEQPEQPEQPKQPKQPPTNEPKPAEPAPESSVNEPASDSSQPPQQVISLFVKGSVQGALLLQMMTELGCKFGDMGIFHRYQQTSGKGPMIFSVANMFNPGTFDLDNIENFETEGVALFMTLPQECDGQQAFNMMLNAAKKLAMEIPQGQVLDADRQLLSRQSIQKTHQLIREFETAQQDL
ncbi:MAG: cell division protein ZipA [Pseudomonadota bacterium]